MHHAFREPQEVEDGGVEVGVSTSIRALLHILSHQDKVMLKKNCIVLCNYNVAKYKSTS